NNEKRTQAHSGKWNRRSSGGALAGVATRISCEPEAGHTRRGAQLLRSAATARCYAVVSSRAQGSGLGGSCLHADMDRVHLWSSAHSRFLALGEVKRCSEQIGLASFHSSTPAQV